MPGDKRQDDKPPVLTPEEDKAQRGTDPPGAFGHTELPSGELAPGWEPSDTAQEAERLIKELGQGREKPPRREDVLPYLMIRAYSPGDRGARPTWPSIPCWESPDILLIDADWTGPFDPSQLVASPTAGRSYRVFVRIWNLGLVPAIGVHVRAWHVNPGFFGGNPGNPAYQPIEIGGAMLPMLEDRTKPGATAIVELDKTWDIDQELTGHECLMATVSCPADPWGGALDANHDRHVGQRNLTILAGDQSAKELIHLLGNQMSKEGTLQLVHGGGAVLPMLRGVLGATKTELGPVEELRAPSRKAFRVGVATGSGVHLLTMLRVKRGWLVADSRRVWELAVELGLVKGRVVKGRVVVRGGHPFDSVLGSRRLIDKLGPKHHEQIGVVLDGDPGDALVEGMAQLWDLGDVTAANLAGAIAEGPGVHLLRFAHHEPDFVEDGGYSVTLLG